ncbi:cytochrome b [Corticibacter populi]|uniref:Cytochrome b n=1 Tax=Corticibacter populi TaxID=1550736 RepID=A0A3M6QY44_9BURK|nr:cytochrome b [Corticibacter populi]RMX07928.1 cytochrome b [Corticibacter populi]RZS35167.1 cytochrome b561 [Corticibacter populi]
MVTPTPSAPSRWLDTPQRYGRISRLLHWSMALVLLWLFVGMGLKIALGLSPRDSWIVGSHSSFGFIAWLLLLVRGTWALINLRNRPSYGSGLVAQAARAGHVLLYLLMLAVPTLALMRQYGSGRGLQLFGSIPIIPAGDKIDWLTVPANATRELLGLSTHGLLAWTLLALIAGHIAMVVVHHRIWKDDTAYRMIGARLY